MVETLRPELLPREISVKADLPQIAYRWAAVHQVLLCCTACLSLRPDLSDPPSYRQASCDGSLVGMHQSTAA